MEDGGRGLQEIKWFGGDSVSKLFDVVGVVTANAGDGARSADAEKAGGHGCGVGRQGCGKWGCGGWDGIERGGSSPKL